MEDGVERVAREVGGRFEVVREGGRVGRQLEQVVQPLRSLGGAQDDARLQRAARGEGVARGQP